VTTGVRQRCIAPLEWPAESVSMATAKPARGSECSDETGLTAAPGNGAVIAIAKRAPFSSALGAEHLSSRERSQYRAERISID